MLYGTVDNRLREGETAAAPPVDPSSWSERWNAAVDAQIKAHNLNSDWSVKEAAFDAADDGIFQLTGIRLGNPFRDGLAEAMDPAAIERRTGRNPVSLFEEEIERLAVANPDKAREIRRFGGVLDRAYATRNAAVARLDDVTARSPGAVNLPLIGPVDPLALAGGMWGSLYDPATIAVNAVGALGKGGSLLYHFTRSALINAGAEVAQQPFIKQWANEAGDPYGWDDAARSVAAAALLGGALDLAVRGGYRGVQHARGLEPVREGGLVTGWRSPEERAVALDDAAARLPEDNPVRRMRDGDVAAAREVAEATGAIEDPAVRGAIMAREMSDDLDGPPPMNVDGGEGMLSLTQALRAAVDPDEPPPHVLASFAREGLDMSQAARMARAREMGFDTEKVWYHGTRQDFEAFQPRGHVGEGTGVSWFTPNAWFADYFNGTRSDYGSIKDDGGSTIPVLIRRGKQLVVDANGQDPYSLGSAYFAKDIAANYARHHAQFVNAIASRVSRSARNVVRSIDTWQDAEAWARDASYYGETPERYTTGETLERVRAYHEVESAAPEALRDLWTAVDTPLRSTRALFDHAARENVDSILFTKMHDNGGIQDQLAVLDPANIRSVNAAFDPAETASPRLLASLPREARRALAAEAVARADKRLPHDTLLGARRTDSAPQPQRLDDVAGAEAKAQTVALERDLASSIEEATKPQALQERADALAQIRRAPETRARTTTDSLDSATIEVPALLTSWLAVPHRKFEANFRAIAAKRRARPSPGVDLSTPEKVRTFVERVLTDADFAFRRAGDEWDVVAVDGDKAVIGVRLAASEGKYSVRTALAMDSAQLGTAIARAVGSFGVDAVRWRDSHGASLVHGLLPGSEAGAGPPSIKQLIKKLRRAQLGQADLAIAAGHYVHTPAAAARMAEIRAAVDSATRMLPPDVQVRVRERLDMDGVPTDGAWSGYDRIVYLSAQAPEPGATLRHETIHALRETGLLTDGEFDTLYAFAERIGVRQAADIDARYGDIYRKAYGDRGEAGVEALLREETVAELFGAHQPGRRFAKEDPVTGGLVDRILATITRFIARVRDALRGYSLERVDDIFEAIESGAMAGRQQQGRVTLPDGAEIDGFHLFAIRAFHGTPHEIERFDSSKIGTGEGAQAYGHGLYFAESEGVARFYRDSVTNQHSHMIGSLTDPITTALNMLREARHAIARFGAGDATDYAIQQLDLRIADYRQRRSLSRPATPENLSIAAHLQTARDMIARGEARLPVGRLYEVRIDAEPEQFLDWNKPLGQQSDAVQSSAITVAREEAARELQRRARNNARNDTHFRSTFGKEPPERPDEPSVDELALRMWGNEFARGNEAALSEAGIIGVRYLDHGSRAAGVGSYNFVIFPGREHLIEIVAVDGKPVVSLAQDLADAKRDGGLGKLVEACRL